MRVMSGISGRLLVLTILVVMLVEVAIFVPSVAQFRLQYLEERLVRGEIAALTVMAAPDGYVAPELQMRLLEAAGIQNVVVQDEGTRILALPGTPATGMVRSYDLREAGAFDLVRDAIGCLFTTKDGPMRVVGRTERGIYDAVEIMMQAEPLRAAMLGYGLRILQLSLLISVVTAAIVFLVVRRFVVAPLLDVVENMKLFQANPEDEARVIRPASRLGEVAEAERALEAMERDVQAALRARGRLASLGEAVAKVSHDLRNMLATAQLMADRLEMSRDPIVARAAPKLIGALDRAVRLCERTLAYGRAEEPAPEPRLVDLAALVADIAVGLALPPPVPHGAGNGGAADGGMADGGMVPPAGPVTVETAIPADCAVRADPEQLYRILANLIRNAAEAIRAAGRPGVVRVSAETGGGSSRITVADTGPGMPERALATLFRPFAGAARAGGTGLGLAIAFELARAHGGRLELVSTSPRGTVFAVFLPAGTAAGAGRGGSEGRAENGADTAGRSRQGSRPSPDRPRSAAEEERPPAARS